MVFTSTLARGRAALAPSPIALLRSSEFAHPERQVASGDLVRVRRGILAPGPQWHALAPWQRYLARVHAVMLTHPGVVLCLESAAAAQGLPVFGDPGTVHILAGGHGTSRMGGGVRVHTTAGDRAIDDLGGAFVTTAIDTVVDLARLRHGAVGLAVADAALRADPSVTVEMLVAANEARPSSRGRRTARWPLHRAAPLAETPLESVSRAVVEWLGFEEPELQREFRTDDVVDRCDMWWPRARIIGEADGEVKYDGSLQNPATAIRNEKSRDRRLLTHAARIAHWGWPDAVQVDPLRTTLRAAGLRPIRPESSPELYALRAAVRAPHPSRASG